MSSYGKESEAFVDLKLSQPMFQPTSTDEALMVLARHLGLTSLSVSSFENQAASFSSLSGDCLFLKG